MQMKAVSGTYSQRPLQADPKTATDRSHKIEATNSLMDIPAAVPVCLSLEKWETS